MNAADWNRALVFWDHARRWLTRVNILAAAIGAAVVMAYCSGKRAGVRQSDAAHYRVIRDTLVETIRVVNERLRVDTVRVRIAATKADSSQRAFARADSAVRAVADTSPVVPSALVLPALHACELALADKDSVIAAERQAFMDAMQGKAAEQRRADLAEQQLAAGHAGFGFKSGVAAGAALVAVLVKVLR